MMNMKEALRRLRKLPLILIMFFKREEKGKTGEKELSILLNKTRQRNIVKYQSYNQKYNTRLQPSLDYIKLLDSPLGKVELSSVVASNSDDMDPMLIASGASSSTTSICVTSPKTNIHKF